MNSSRLRYRLAILLYDRLYRVLHRLDTPASEVGPALRVEVRRSRRALSLPDGTRVRCGERIGILHLNNDRIAAVRGDGLPSVSLALELRRQVFASLHALATLATSGGPLADVRAFSATTIFHQGLARIGFQPEPDGYLWPRLVAVYQRALITALRPGGTLRLERSTYRRARRLWISRGALLARYGDGPPPGGVGSTAPPDA